MSNVRESLTPSAHAPAEMETLEQRQLYTAEINVTAPGTGGDISDGQSTAIFFPATPQGQVADNGVFTIRNTGNTVLNLGNISVPQGFVLVSGPGDNTLAPNQQTTITVRLNTAAVGIYEGQLSIVNNDPNENPFNFPIRGRVISADAPQDIDVFANGPKVEPGETIPVNVGQVAVGGTKTFTFRVRNDGAQPLTISGLNLPTGFTLTDGLRSTIAAGDSDFFTIRVDSATQGVKSGNIVIRTNDPNANEANFTFAVRATVGNVPTGITPDAFEGATGDNVAPNARFHSLNGRYRFHNIHNTGDTDWVKFYIPQTSYVAIRAVHPGSGGVRFRLYGPKANQNPDGIAQTNPLWNSQAVPGTGARADDTILVRAGVRALTTGWYWLNIDGQGGTVANYGVRVYARPLPASAPTAQPVAATSTATKSFAFSTTSDKSDDADALGETSPVLPAPIA